MHKYGIMLHTVQYLVLKLVYCVWQLCSYLIIFFLWKSPWQGMNHFLTDKNCMSLKRRANWNSFWVCTMQYLQLAYNNVVNCVSATWKCHVISFFSDYICYIYGKLNSFDTRVISDRKEIPFLWDNLVLNYFCHESIFVLCKEEQ